MVTIRVAHLVWAAFVGLCGYEGWKRFKPLAFARVFSAARILLILGCGGSLFNYHVIPLIKDLGKQVINYHAKQVAAEIEILAAKNAAAVSAAKNAAQDADVLSEAELSDAGAN